MRPQIYTIWGPPLAKEHKISNQALEEALQVRKPEA